VSELSRGSGSSVRTVHLAHRRQCTSICRITGAIVAHLASSYCTIYMLWSLGQVRRANREMVFIGGGT
jgi:hypothetical protein